MARHIAIDCHRRTCFLVAADEEGNELFHRRFDTTAEGEQELLRHLQPGDTVVMEATTGVFRLANRLESTGAQVTVVDPQHARLVGFRGKKTDYRDCRALLELLRARTLVPVWRPDPQTRHLRRLTRERRAYNQTIVRTKNRIRALLWEEGLQVDRDLWSQAGQDWLARQRLSPSARDTLERELSALRVATILKQDLDQGLTRIAMQVPEVQRLMQVAGFGLVTSVMLLGETGTIGRFPSPRHLVSYAGLDPRVHQSGDRCHGGRISKAGRSQLRWIMVEVAWAHVAAGGAHARHYHRLVARGKPKGVAITALARRLLVIAYRMLTREETYREIEAAQYEAKLQKLAARRSLDDEPEVSNVDWAARRLKELTGIDSPYRSANPRSRPRYSKRVREGLAAAESTAANAPDPPLPV